MNVHDYIVVGGGSAGCTVTHRLVKAGKSVLMIEAGPNDDNQFVHMPGGFVRLFSTERVQFYLSEPQAAAGGRPIAVPQGRTLGGGSSVNAMIYIRGAAADYDEWRDMGNPGWGWDDVLPVFKRAEVEPALGRTSARHRGAVAGFGCALPPSAQSRRPARGARSGLSLQRRLQRRVPAGRRLLSGHTARRRTRLGRLNLSARGAGQPDGSKSSPMRSVGKLMTENGAAVGVTFTDKSGAAGRSARPRGSDPCCRARWRRRKSSFCRASARRRIWLR